MSTGADAVLGSDSGALPSSQSTPALSLSLPIRWSQALPMCALAAAIAAAVMVFGLMVPFLAATAAGFLAVVFYRRRNPHALVKAGVGARLGAVSGLLCFGMSAILEALGLALFHKGALLRDKMLEGIQKASAQTTDPQALAMLEYFKSPAGLAIMTVFVLIFTFLALVILASLGGALGGALLGRRDRM